MAKKKKIHFTVHMPWQRRLRYLSEAAFVYLLWGFFKILPVTWASAIAGSTLKFIGPKLAASRKAFNNIADAFPEKTADEHQKILVGMWENLGRVVGEYPHLNKIWERTEVIGGDHLHALKKSGKSGILFGGHFSNWEVQPLVTVNHGLDVGIVYRKPNNPYVADLIYKTRCKTGNSIQIEKSAKGARQLTQILKKDGIVGMLMDQKLNQGMPIPFFGRDAMTAPSLGQFSLKFDATVIPIQIARKQGVSFKATVYPPMEIQKTGDKEADVRKVLTEMNQYFEDWIRENPEQWLWLHRRWH